MKRAVSAALWAPVLIEAVAGLVARGEPFMARGVSENFLQVASREQRLGRRSALLAVVLLPLAAFLAELADAPAYGSVWALFVVCAIAGLGVGVLVGKRRLARYEADLRQRWNHWMRQAVRAERMAEVERRVHDRDPSPSWWISAAAPGLVAANVAVFALLWVEHSAGELAAALVVGLDGLALGGLIATSVLMSRWASDLVRSARQLVSRGELPLWGER